MITIRYRNGNEAKVEGSVEEIINTFNSKPNTIIKKSRIDENLTVWINGINAGDIILPKYQALSPDLIPIDSEIYEGREAREKALSALKKWSKRYKKQGYYSSNEGRIELIDLLDECYIVEC